MKQKCLQPRLKTVESIDSLTRNENIVEVKSYSDFIFFKKYKAHSQLISLFS